MNLSKNFINYLTTEYMDAYAFGDRPPFDIQRVRSVFERLISSVGYHLTEVGTFLK
jgi:hypothetical protein